MRGRKRTWNTQTVSDVAISVKRPFQLCRRGSLIQKKIAELQNLKMSPVCLFPTRKQCDDINKKVESFRN